MYFEKMNQSTNPYNTRHQDFQVIEPVSKRRLIDLSSVKAYRELFILMVKRDISVLYRNSSLGVLWALLNPLLSMLIFTLVFGKFQNSTTNGKELSIFFLSALVPWAYFSQSVSNAASSLFVQRNVITKVYFPRIFIPLTPVASKLLDFTISFAFLLVFSLVVGVLPDIRFLFIPFGVVNLILVSAGFSLWTAALSARFRDIRFAIGYLLQMIMFLSPVVYSTARVISYLNEQAGFKMAAFLYGLFPMVGVIECFRAGFGQSQMDINPLLISGFISSCFILLSGLMYFNATEQKLADIL